MKEFWKLVSIWQSCVQQFGGAFLTSNSQLPIFSRPWVTHCMPTMLQPLGSNFPSVVSCCTDHVGEMCKCFYWHVPEDVTYSSNVVRMTATVHEYILVENTRHSWWFDQMTLGLCSSHQQVWDLLSNEMVNCLCIYCLDISSPQTNSASCHSRMANY